MKRALLVINPSAGLEKAKKYEDFAIEKLEGLFDELTIKYTEKSGDASAFASQAAKDSYDSVFVMGGDGTVNEGINGLAEHEHRPNFGFFPLGTVNDLARALSIPLDPQKAIEGLDLSKSKKVDIGKINDKYFMNVVAIGVIPEAVNDVDSSKKTRLGRFAYFVSGFKQFKNTQSYAFSMLVDGEEKHIQSSMILIGLTNSIGGFEQILPNAVVDDGMLHMIYLKDETILDTIRTFPDLLKGVDTSSNYVGYLQLKQVSIKSDDEHELATNIDGDEGDKLPIDIRVLPAHINVYCG
ncbi:MAG: diacylglycerol kinase family lipid kinase [Peptostreptococcus sp.]|uniref:diacylglycerol/lipid kinase family protein n=1 Tax=Peptostreptococcus sp. TaxID=1262 RepID=UPI002FC659CE